MTHFSENKFLFDVFDMRWGKFFQQTGDIDTQLKRKLFPAKISECKVKMKESWEIIFELLNKRSKSSNIDFLKDSELTFVNKKAISNAMSNFL